MTVLRFLRADVRESARVLAPVVLIAFVLFIGIDAVLWLKCVRFIQMGKDATAPTFGDCFAALYGGALNSALNDNERISLPMSWVAVMAVVLYAPLSYPYSNLMGFGKQLIVQGNSRWQWWVAKCLWVALCTGAMALIALLSAFLVSSLAGGELTLRVQDNLPGLLGLNGRAFLEETAPIGSFVVQVEMCLLSLCLAQLALSLVLRPLPAFVLVIGMVSLSIFYSGFPFVGELCMWARTSLAVPVSVNPLVGIGTSAVLAAASVALGGLYFSKMDILDKELVA